MQVLAHYRPAGQLKKTGAGLISVIVAAYNIENYIEKCVRSICDQTYRDLEIIVVDDGSTDQTGVILDRLAGDDARLRVIHKKNGGLAEARNVGMSQASGDYIGFVDGDDWIDESMYGQMLGALLDTHSDAAVCRYRQVYKAHTEDGSQDRAVVFEGQEALQCYVEEKEEYAIQNAAWNKLYKKEILAQLKFPVGKWYEDIVFTTMALARVGRCIYLDTAYYNYIIDREGSIMNIQVNRRTFTDQIPAYYEKTKFLQGIGRQDLADVHDYFFYKRVLLFYVQVKRMESPEKTAYLSELQEILYGNAEHVRQVFRNPAADPRDGRKAALFLKSPARYYRRVCLDEKVVVPLKRVAKKILGWR